MFLFLVLISAASNFSFPKGTEALTPDGPVAIETLREGDLVIARNEDTGVSGVFPVSAVMGRQASEVLWLTLENTEGEVTRMGVTPTHPLFIAGSGWGEAGALVPGDAIRDKDLQALTVLAVEVDTRPQMVHNLEIADAHTYFAGELEAWGHNGYGPTNTPLSNQALKYLEYWKRLGQCPCCGKVMAFTGGPRRDVATIEHMTPRIKGGTNDPGNRDSTCCSCNSSMGSRPKPPFPPFPGR